MALHWRIVVALVVGAIFGLVLNWTWDARTWRSLGVSDPAAFLAGSPVETASTPRQDATDPSDAQDDLHDPLRPSTAAYAARFLVNLNDFIGQLFLRCLRFVAVPIVLSSLIVGVASLGDLRKLGRIGLTTITIYLLTTAVAVVLGLTLANLVRPGLFVSPEVKAQLMAQNSAEVTAAVGKTGAVQSLWRQILDLVPENPFAALANATMLQVIVTAIALGVGLTLIPREKSAVVVTFFDAIADVVVKLIHAIMLLAPLAVFALIVPKIATMGISVLSALLAFSLVAVAGMAIMVMVEYPILLRVFGKVGYTRFLKAMMPAQLLAFSSSSSSATLPVTLQCATRRLGVPKKIAGFVCPLGATINMDGTAMYQGVATVFIAQMSGVDLTLSQQLTVILLAVLASIGTPGIPGAGMVMLVVVLGSVGLPAEGIAVIMAVDRLLDMCRTVVNVTGDAMASVIVARREGLELTPDPAD